MSSQYFFSQWIILTFRKLKREYIKVKGLLQVEKGLCLPTFSMLELDQANLHDGIAPVVTMQP